MKRWLWVLFAASVCHAQARKPYVPPQTVHGDPDLHGIWTNVTITPLERPAQFANKPFLTRAEAEAYQKDTVAANNADRRDLPAERDVGLAYNDFWYDRGRWEGQTLLVETTNFSEKNVFRGATPAMRLTERFTRAAPDEIRYQFTVNDPETFTKPWTAEIPLPRTEGPIYEYACHEGNYAMEDMLRGARVEEQKTHK